MPAKKAAKAEKTASAKSKAKVAAPPKFDAEAEITGIIERLECLEKTVNAIRADFKSKGIPMP